MPSFSMPKEVAVRDLLPKKSFWLLVMMISLGGGKNLSRHPRSWNRKSKYQASGAPFVFKKIFWLFLDLFEWVVIVFLGHRNKNNSLTGRSCIGIYGNCYPNPTTLFFQTVFPICQIIWLKGKSSNPSTRAATTTTNMWPKSSKRHSITFAQVWSRGKMWSLEILGSLRCR